MTNRIEVVSFEKVAWASRPCRLIAKSMGETHMRLNCSKPSFSNEIRSVGLVIHHWSLIGHSGLAFRVSFTGCHAPTMPIAFLRYG